MPLTKVPAGWTMNQLSALNELIEIARTYQMVREVKQVLGDNTAESQRVLDDMRLMAIETWNQVKTFTP